jgi:hypothetical protein
LAVLGPGVPAIARRGRPDLESGAPDAADRAIIARPGVRAFRGGSHDPTDEFGRGALGRAVPDEAADAQL